MLPAPFSQALVLTGPTASGKTSLAIDLARRLDAEIVSMDSMALYRHMNVGTAKPTLEQRRLVPHHMIDVLDPWEWASVAWWLQRAAACCREIEGRGKQVLFVGGTPLYLKALMFGLFDGPAADPLVRNRLAEEARLLGSSVLHDRLARIDPVAAQRIHPNDQRRIIRALEVFELTGQRISTWQREWVSRDAPAERGGAAAGEMTAVDFPCSLWLDLPRAELYEKINGRVQEMFDTGLIEEAFALRRVGPACRVGPFTAAERVVQGPARQAGPTLSKEACQAVGYAEVFAHLDGLCTLAEAIERVRVRTRQFAKRQVTWFRHLPDCFPASSELTWKLWQPKMSLERTSAEELSIE